MEKEQLYEIIEQYLEGTLSGEALDNFEQRLQAEPDFAEEVALHRKLQQELGDAKKRQLRAKLDVLRAEFTEPEEETKIVPINRNRNLRKFISLAASVLVLVFAIWFFFFKTPEKWEIVIENPPTEKQEIDPQNDTPIEEMEDPSNLVEDNSTPQKGQKENDIEENTPPKNLIANFQTNPELEQLIAQNDAQEDVEFSVEMPSTGEPFTLKNGQINLQINGMLFASEIKDENNFTVEVYDNDPQHFKSKKQVATFQLSIEKDTSEDDDGLAFAVKEAYFYKLEKALTTAPGLYYYLIFQKGQTSPLFTGKFEVKE